MKTEISSKTQVLDLRYLTISDFSVYNPDIEVTSPIYRITLPNFNKYVDVPYEPGSITNINSNLLNLTASNVVGGLATLPSGIWKINHSICPNDKLFKEYVFFNISPDLQQISDAVCCHKDEDEILDKLWDIKRDFEIAKILAEDCNDTNRATAMYNQAHKALNRIGCQC